MGGTWRAFQETWAIIDEIDGLRALQLYSPATRYSDASSAARRANESGDSDYDGDDWPLAGYVRTFARPVWLSRRGRRFWTRRTSRMKRGGPPRQPESDPGVGAPGAAGDADALAQRRFSLLFLDAELAGRWTFELPWSDREEVEVPSWPADLCPQRPDGDVVIALPCAFGPPSLLRQAELDAANRLINGAAKDVSPPARTPTPRHLLAPRETRLDGWR